MKNKNKKIKIKKSKILLQVWATRIIYRQANVVRQKQCATNKTIRAMKRK